MSYNELQVTTNFSFLQGASHPEEIVIAANELGYGKTGICDRNTLAGIVRAHVAAKKMGNNIIPGSRLDLVDGYSIIAYPMDKQAYSSLSELLSIGNLRTEKGKCELYKEDVLKVKSRMKWILVPPTELNRDFTIDQAFENQLSLYREAFHNDLYVAISKNYNGDDAKRLHLLSKCCKLFDTPLVATNDVYYHEVHRRQLQDILTCIREKKTIQNAGYLLLPNAERHLKPIKEMKRLFRNYPEAIQKTFEIGEACTFSLDELRYVYPEEITSGGRSPQEELSFLAWKGAEQRYGLPLPEITVRNIQHELKFIEEMNYAAYFLTVYDIVKFARQQNILCQGRGSAANSTICYVLGITSVDPTKFDLLFERFISSARNEPPDIDVDFEHERREEVIQYIYTKYGRDRAAIVATVTQQHQKGAIRDVGKAMGLTVDTISKLSSAIWEFNDEWFEGRKISEQGFNPKDPHLKKVLQLTKEFMGFPRQLGQHTGGFVITQGKLTELCPILNARMEDRTCIEWNKDDIDALKILKIDVLALGMLTCIRKAFDLLKKHYDMDLTLASIPQDDPRVYDMICRADTIGVFQIESRAQMTMLPRLKPRNFYDLVIEVAIVRPGPIQGDMVHPYLRRRNGQEPVTYPSKDLENILKRTLGVPLFQEQAMKIAIVAAGFTPAEADELRRSMATFKMNGMMERFEEKLVRGMLANGYSKDYALRVFKQLEGFGSYGFPESHAASFALLVYVSAWIKCFYPDVFSAALLNSMPMGFYQPAQIIQDAIKHGVTVREADVNYSDWDNTLEEKTGTHCPLRLGFRQIKGLKKEDVDKLMSSRKSNFSRISELKDIGLLDASLHKLADADAFRSMSLDRREALWQVSIKNFPIAIFKGQEIEKGMEKEINLPKMPLSEHVVQDYSSTSLSIKAHPVSFVREKLENLKILASKDLHFKKNGEYVKVAGLVLVRQRPGTAKGVCFMTIEDEFGFINLVIWEKKFEEYRKAVLQSKLIMIEGELQKEGDVIHVIAERCHNFSSLLRTMTPDNNHEPSLLTLARPDEKNVIPEGRNFK